MIVVIGGENNRHTSSGNAKNHLQMALLMRANSANIKIHHSKVFNKNKFLEDVRNHFRLKRCAWNQF